MASKFCILGFNPSADYTAGFYCDTTYPQLTHFFVLCSYCKNVPCHLWTAAKLVHTVKGCPSPPISVWSAGFWPVCRQRRWSLTNWNSLFSYFRGTGNNTKKHLLEASDHKCTVVRGWGCLKFSYNLRVRPWEIKCIMKLWTVNMRAFVLPMFGCTTLEQARDSYQDPSQQVVVFWQATRKDINATGQVIDGSESNTNK